MCRCVLTFICAYIRECVCTDVNKKYMTCFCITSMWHTLQFFFNKYMCSFNFHFFRSHCDNTKRAI